MNPDIEKIIDLHPDAIMLSPFENSGGYGKDVIQLEQRMAELAAADAARTKKHHERHAATPEH